jgi:hypothetical protein
MDNKQRIDALKSELDQEIWLKMKISAIRKGQRIHDWIQDAIVQKLKMEEQNEK